MLDTNFLHYKYWIISLYNVGLFVNFHPKLWYFSQMLALPEVFYLLGKRLIQN